MSTAAAVNRALADAPKPTLPVGAFAGANPDGTVQIDFGQGEVTCLSAGTFEPLLGQSVRCLRTTDGTVMIGPAQPPSAVGQVVTAGSPLLTVNTTIGDLDLPYLASYTPRNVGDVVLIVYGSVLGELSATPAGAYIPSTPAGPTARTADFRATDSGSWNGAWWTADVWGSTSNDGAWFYGSQIADTIEDAGTVTRVQIYLPEFYADGDPAELAVHTSPSKSGGPSLSGNFPVAHGAGWRDLPASYGELLKTGAAYGIGVQSDALAWHKYRSRAADADSGLLRIDWTV